MHPTKVPTTRRALIRLLCFGILGLDHDESKEGENDCQAKEEEDDGNANRVLAWREEVM